jgi:hypothetical protein
LAEPDRSLVIVFDLLNEASTVPGGSFRYPFQVLAIRSTDGGATWSDPVHIATLPQYGSRYNFDTADGYPLQVNVWPSSKAQGRDGSLYVAWAAAESATRTRIEIASSPDGMAWSAPKVIASVPGEAFEPTISVDRRGGVGVLWYDLRRDRPGDGKATTDVLVARSRDGGTTWSRKRRVGSFDYAKAPELPGFEDVQNAARFLGDYFGAAGVGRGFATAFGMPTPDAASGKGPARVYFARVRAPRG